VRVSRTVGRGHLTAAILCAPLWPVGVAIPALVTLALAATIWVALHAYEIIRWHEARAKHAHSPARVEGCDNGVECALETQLQADY
jgi:hypothetical protein